MAQLFDYDAIDVIIPTDRPAAPKPTARVPSSRTAPEVPALLTKKWLCAHFGFISAAGRAHPRQLYKYVLTDEVIRAAGLTPDQVRHRGFKIFDARASALLKQTLFL